MSDKNSVIVIDDEEKNDSSIRWQTVVGGTEEILDCFHEYARIINKGSAGWVTVEDAAAKYGVRAGKVATSTATKAMVLDKTFTVGGIATSGIKVWDSGLDIYNVWKDPTAPLNERILTTGREGLYGLEASSKAVKGTLDLFGICKNLSDKIGSKIAPWLKIGGGYLQCVSAIDDSSREEFNAKSFVGNSFKFLAGTADMIGGGCEFGVATAPLAVPLGIAATTFLIAGDLFKSGEWGWGIATLLVGTIIEIIVVKFMKAVLKKAFEELLKLVFKAFGTTNIPFLSNPFTAALAVTVAALLISLAAQALAKLTNFAQGGFPVYGQPFIAREAGPELVGTMNGRNAVINNDQIVEAVSVGVSQAWVAAMLDNGSNTPAIARVFLDGKEISMARQS